MNNSLYTVFKFLTELIFATALFVIPLKRRKLFLLRLAICLLVCYAVSRIYNREMASYAWVAVARYIYLFALVVLTIFICFDVNLKTALFCGVSGYAVQHFTFKLYGLFEILYVDKVPVGVIVTLYILFFAIIYAGFYFLIARRIRNDKIIKLKSTTVILLGMCIVLCLIVFSVIYTIQSKKIDISIWLRVVYSFYAMMSCLFVLGIQFGIFQKSELEIEMREMEHIWQQEKRQMEFSKETFNLINIKCHDLKHQLSALHDKVSQEELDDLKRKIDIYDSSVKTGNEILDVILAEKSLICQGKGIKLTCMAEGQYLDFMASSDIYSLFGNALDNAIEASTELTDEDSKYIKIAIRKAKGLLSVHIENFYFGELKFKDGLPQTTKTDTDYHGFGTKSIKMIVEKYKGTLKISAENGVFNLNMIFPSDD